MKDTIKEYLAGQYDAYVKDLETLTNIDSGNGDLQGTELLLNSVIMTGRAI